ncbi:MAG: ABC transporter ATP-binding protein [Lentisphaerae bacterium]|nr:ABC transporter ATP-binding protein [Lentisphaerota bacterium]
MDHSFEKIVSIDGVTKAYSRKAGPVLNDVSLFINKAEFFGILGPNGAGKTTLISILVGILKPDSGNVTVMGANVKKDFALVKSKIGVVTQEVALYEDLTARENFEIFGRLYGLSGRRLQKRIGECLEMTGLIHKADSRVSTYSGGMKRLANLVVGFLHDPELLIVDEPTVGVDVHSRHRIYEALIGMNRGGMSIIYTSHYMEEAERLCSRIAIIDRGNILACSPTSELIGREGANGSLEKLFLQLTREGNDD